MVGCSGLGTAYTQTLRMQTDSQGRKAWLQVMLRVTDLDRSIKWYTEALGCNLIRTRDNPDNGYKLAFLGKFNCLARQLALDTPAQVVQPTSRHKVKMCHTIYARGTFAMADALHPLVTSRTTMAEACWCMHNRFARKFVS